MSCSSPAVREDQPLRRCDWRAALGVAPRRQWDMLGCAPTWLSATPLMHSSVRQEVPHIRAGRQGARPPGGKKTTTTKGG
jgi:hypothetical protein